MANASQIHTIQDQLDAIQTSQDRLHSVAKVPSHPALLFDSPGDASIEDLVNSLPSKAATDLLVNVFTRDATIATLAIPLPTFLKDYEVFWENPQAATLPWLSILFSIIVLSLQFILRSGSKIEGIPFPESACGKYLSKAAQCLKISDYAVPAPKTVEAMVRSYK